MNNSLGLTGVLCCRVLTGEPGHGLKAGVRVLWHWALGCGRVAQQCNIMYVCTCIVYLSPGNACSNSTQLQLQGRILAVLLVLHFMDRRE
ncbi:hypothetical protein BDN72DRAFT_459200 [Pluteus cervinus]|uniref:Uncharacterized protein n=1 Tax=Pluteus cervinus TaxID=181527 RepID=A0ACD3B0D5_9AGAR|nr:hypothetical protein BDN72DRAFT_459200 [Pluteus cervinus]